ncbi:hypothetical protein HELRODRAFT_180796 [Helobdella robusta]|uniref:Uncharacterized protein n=1 Tax=Helobdella robusta TaxID=6412 RepID=T1FGA3_HELRO|nr:hypothetical protein HELRODRAFT_180796 [Helobdella robusta]ESN93480.1 hypothetical protein HELRODRAFT_180796 [Helobdella robusta]
MCGVCVCVCVRVDDKNAKSDEEISNSTVENTPKYPTKWLITEEISYFHCLAKCKNNERPWTLACIIHTMEFPFAREEGGLNCFVIWNASDLEPFKYDKHLSLLQNSFLFAIQNGAKYIKSNAYTSPVELERVGIIIDFKETSKSYIFHTEKPNYNDGDDVHDDVIGTISATVSDADDLRKNDGNSKKEDDDDDDDEEKKMEIFPSLYAQSYTPCSKVKLCENYNQSPSLFISNTKQARCSCLLDKFNSISTESVPVDEDSILTFSYNAFVYLPLEYLVKTDARFNCLFQYFIRISGSFFEVYKEIIEDDNGDDDNNNSNNNNDNKEKKMISECQREKNNFRECLRVESNYTRCFIRALQKFIDKDEMESFKIWLKMLKSVGFPELKFGKNSRFQNKICSYITLNTLSEVRSHSDSTSDSTAVVKTKSKNSEINQRVYKEMCLHDDTRAMINFKNTLNRKRNIVLIIVFNNPFYEVIPILELIYRPLYPKIFYCGPKRIDLKKYRKLLEYNLSFLTFDIQPEKEVKGALNYHCTLKVMKLQHRSIEGYLTISDDMLLLQHQIVNLNPDYIWFLPEKEIRIGDLENLKECRLGICDFFNRWTWWEIYQKEGLDVLKSLPKEKSETLRACAKYIRFESDGENRLLGGYSDIYYVPRFLANSFVEIGDYFLKKRLFLEIAIPNALRCLNSFENMVPLKGLQIWDVETHGKPWLHITKSKLFDLMYFHPLKWSYYYNSSSYNHTGNAKNNQNTEKILENNFSKVSQNSGENIDDVKKELEKVLCDKVLKYLHHSAGLLPE